MVLVMATSKEPDAVLSQKRDSQKHEGRMATRLPRVLGGRAGVLARTARPESAQGAALLPPQGRAHETLETTNVCL